MPSRKRKAPAATVKTKSADAAAKSAAKSAAESAPAPVRPCLVQAVVRNAQANEAFHTKYIKELKLIYTQLGHDAFVVDFRRAIQQLMVRDDTSKQASTGLRFLAKFATSYDTEDTHPLLGFTFNWILDTVSKSPVIRFRLCQFVNLLLNSLSNDAALDDSICDNILRYMVDRMRDVSATVRVQALTAMQRLQMPDNPNDHVVKIYQHHLNSDPSPLVRQAVITSIGRNQHTIQFILDRFWDVDDKVRRHAFLHMCTYSVKSYRVVQRLQFIEQGLNDPSESVRKVLTKVLIPAWLEAYHHDYIRFVAALKLDASEQDIERFRAAARLVLAEIFKRQPVAELIAALPLYGADEELGRCITLERLTVESSLYWLALIVHLTAAAEAAGDGADGDGDAAAVAAAGHLDRILPEMTTFCTYMRRYLERASAQPMDKWQKLEHHFVLLTLCEIINTFDLSDELGRCNMRRLLCDILTLEEFDETIVAKVVACLERVVPDADQRLQLVAEIVRNVWDTGSASLDLSSASVVELLARNSNLNFKVSSMKLRIMDLEEQERDSIQQKEYGRAEKLRDEVNECNEQLAALIGHHLKEDGGEAAAARSGEEGAADVIPQSRRVNNQQIMRCIQMAYHVVRTESVRSLNPSIVKVFKDFIRRQMECQHMPIRDHALKCAITFAMLYEQLAKEVYSELFAQFFKHQNSRIWATAIAGMFELIDRYGFEHFEAAASEAGESETGATTAGGSSLPAASATGGGGAGGAGAGRIVRPGAKSQSKPNTTRQLYNAELDGGDDDGTAALLMQRRNADILRVLDHFLDDCTEPYIQKALIDGYCRLLLRSHITGENYVSRMLLKYFNPATEPEITQILGIFFEKLIAHQRQECLQEAMFTTLFAVLEAPADSPLQEIAPEAILTFVIQSTQPGETCSPGLNIHNTIAMSFVDVMSDNVGNKELLRILSRAFGTLHVTVDDAALRKDLLGGLNALLDGGHQLEVRTDTYIRAFRTRLEQAGAEALARQTGGMVFSSEANAVQAGATVAAGQGDRAADANVSSGSLLAPDEEENDDDEETGALNVSDAAKASSPPGSPALPALLPSPAAGKSPARARAPLSQRSPLTPSMPRAAAQAAPDQLATTYGLHNSTQAPRSLRKSLLRRDTATGGDVQRPPGDIENVDRSLAATLPLGKEEEEEENVERRTTNGPHTPKTSERKANPARSTRTRRAAAGAAAVLTASGSSAKRGKRRNDMMAKSPSPRASLCATVSRQTSKKSRTAAAAAAKDTVSNAANAATNASSRRSRRSSEQVTNVSVLLSPTFKRVIDDRMADITEPAAAPTTPAPKTNQPQMIDVSVVLTPTFTRVIDTLLSADRPEVEATQSRSGMPPPSESATDQSQSSDSGSTATRRRRSPSKPKQRPPTATTPKSVRQSTRSSSSASPAKRATASSSQSTDSERTPTRAPAAARSALPLRNGSRAPTTTASAAAPKTTASSNATKPTAVAATAAAAAAAAVRTSKLPHTIKHHRLAAGTIAAKPAATGAVQRTTRGASVQEFIKNNIITRNRRSMENLLSLGRPLNPGAASTASSSSSRSAAANPSIPLRSSNGARLPAAGGVASKATTTTAAGRIPTVAAAAASAVRSTRIPRPSKR